MEPLLSIAGYDPSAGAGVLADVKTMQAHGCYGMAVSTALTFQNEERFLDVNWVPLPQILKQLDVLSEKHAFQFVKIGAIESVFVLHEVLEHIMKLHPGAFVVWDPVLSASAGHDFLDYEDRDMLKSCLDMLDLFTPNRKEMELLAGSSSEQEMLGFAGDKVVTSWKKDEKEIVDIFVHEGDRVSLRSPLSGHDKHGTGCVYSSALLCALSAGEPPEEAARRAQRYVGKYRFSGEGKAGRHFINDSNDILI